MPEHLSKHIDYITPGVKLAKLQKRRPVKTAVNEEQKRAIGEKEKRGEFSLPPIKAPLPSILSKVDAKIDASDT